MTTANLDLCQARIRKLRPDGTDLCRRHATHEHFSHIGNRRLELCTQHLHSLTRRERQGSANDLLDTWLPRAAA